MSTQSFDKMTDFSNYFVLINFTPFLQITASSHSVPPPSNQQKSLPYIFFFFENLFHLDEHQNTEEKTCRYFQYIATLKLVSCWNFKIVSKQNKTFIHFFFFQ